MYGFSQCLWRTGGVSKAVRGCGLSGVWVWFELCPSICLDGAGQLWLTMYRIWRAFVQTEAFCGSGQWADAVWEIVDAVCVCVCVCVMGGGGSTGWFACVWVKV